MMVGKKKKSRIRKMFKRDEDDDLLETDLLNLMRGPRNLQLSPVGESARNDRIDIPVVISKSQFSDATSITEVSHSSEDEDDGSSLLLEKVATAGEDEDDYVFTPDDLDDSERSEKQYQEYNRSGTWQDQSGIDLWDLTAIEEQTDESSIDNSNSSTRDGIPSSYDELIDDCHDDGDADNSAYVIEDEDYDVCQHENDVINDNEMNSLRRAVVPPRALTEDEALSLRKLLKSKLNLYACNSSYEVIACYVEDADDLLDYVVELIDEGNTVGYMIDEVS